MADIDDVMEKLNDVLDKIEDNKEDLTELKARFTDGTPVVHMCGQCSGTGIHDGTPCFNCDGDGHAHIGVLKVD